MKAAGGGLQKVAPPDFNMALLAYDEMTGKVVDPTAIDAVDKILELKATKGPWEVVDTIIKVWHDRFPEEAINAITNVKDIRETRSDQEYGQTEDKNMNRRLILVFPTGLQALIRKVYTAQELQFNHDFFIEFANRYPLFQVPEKL